MKARICDVCEKPIREWESVTYKERFIGCSFEIEGVYPSNDTRRVRVDMCKECHKRFLAFLNALCGRETPNVDSKPPTSPCKRT